MRIVRPLVTFLTAVLVATVLATGATSGSAGAVDSTIHEMIERVNADRAAAGLAPLTLCGRLIDAAQGHAQDQANRLTMTHLGWDGSEVGTRVNRVGYQWNAVAENVAYGYESVHEVSNAWMASPLHRANLLNPGFTHFGVGVARGSNGLRYWTQNFGAGGDCGALPNTAVDPIGSFELASSPSPGKLRVAGWAADPDVGTGAIDVHVFVSGAGYNLGAANDYRPDLGPLGMGGNHGFDEVLTVAPGTHEVCAIAINQGAGGNVSLGCKTASVAAPPTDPVGNLEVVSSPSKGMVRVAGWAADPDQPTIAIRVHVYIDGVGTDLGYADDQRADLAGTQWGTRHGFDTTLPATPGQRQVCAYAINTGPGATTQLGCRSVWVPDPASPFLDVLSSSVAFGDIVWLAEGGVTSGYPDGTFRPGGAVLRETMAAFLYRLAGNPAFTPPPVSPFRDVPTTHVFYREITWLADQGIATGYPDGTFQPTTKVSRGAMAAFLRRMDGNPPVLAGSPSFPDVPIGHVFRADVSWLAAEGVTTGYGDGTFRPGRAVNRAEMASFLQRYDSR